MFASQTTNTEIRQPEHSFAVTFRQFIRPFSFCEKGSVTFLSDALSIHGSLVTNTFLPMTHFFTFFVLAVGGKLIAGDPGLIVGIVVSILLGLAEFVYVNRYLRNVTRIIPYVAISDVIAGDGNMRFRCINRVPSVVAFRVEPIDGERFANEIVHHFPSAFMLR